MNSLEVPTVNVVDEFTPIIGLTVTGLTMHVDLST